MSEIFAWVPWFQELAKKIEAGGPEYLIAHAQKIPWNKDGTESRLLRHGDENIDPLSFFYVLASKNGTTRVYSAITEVCNLSAEVDFKEGFYYPTPQARAKLLFHSGGRGNVDLLWRLFRSAVTGLDSIKVHEFNEVLSIKNVGISKLTQALFLINPREFLPFDQKSLIPLQKKLERASQVNDWETYRREVDAVRGLFPGCEPYEIQHFAYTVFETKELNRKGRKVWRGSTNLGNGKPDGWQDFRVTRRIHYQEPPRLPFALRHPDRGDVVLVHTGLSEGRGIGVVRCNDHKELPAPEQPLRVLWLNTSTTSVDGVLSGERFSEAKKTLGTFRKNPAYERTFDLLTRLGWNEGAGHQDKKAQYPEERQEPTPTPEFRRLADDTLISKGALEEIWKLLEDKKQVIFQGPPGTGKTYLARKLAACLAGDDERVQLVQFHPSYAYEDFVQGYRPTLNSRQAGFKLRDGPLRKMAKLAEKSEEKHFLIIDEINRGNLAKILGELYFLLEYRGYKIPLQYTSKLFSLPPNLYIIGTMNTADRSIALVDLALRRRFHFVEFRPDKPPINGILGRWLDKHKLEQFRWVERAMARANTKLNGHHAALGPSYFMPRDKKLDDERVRRIWEHGVLPYVEEHLFGQADQLKEFDLDQLRKEVDGESPTPAEEASEEVSGADESDNETD